MKKPNNKRQRPANWNDIVEWKRANPYEKIRIVTVVWPSTIDRIGITKQKKGG